MSLHGLQIYLFSAARGKQFVDEVPSLQVSDAVIQPSATIKSLGVTFDRHVANVCKACYFHIGMPRHVRQSLSGDVARIVALQHCRLKA